MRLFLNKERFMPNCPFRRSFLAGIKHRRAGNPDSGQARMAEIGPPEIGISEIGAAKIGFFKICFTQITAGKIGMTQISIEQIGFPETRTPKICSGKIGITQVFLIETRLMQVYRHTPVTFTHVIPGEYPGFQFFVQHVVICGTDVSGPAPGILPGSGCSRPEGALVTGIRQSSLTGI